MSDLVPIEQLKSLNELWFQATELQKQFLLMRRRCETDMECCELLKIDRSNPCQWRKRDEYFSKLETLYKNTPTHIAMMYLDEAMPETVVTQIEIMRNSKSDNLKLQASKDLQKLAIETATLQEKQRDRESKISISTKDKYEE